MHNALISPLKNNQFCLLPFIIGLSSPHYSLFIIAGPHSFVITDQFKDSNGFALQAAQVTNTCHLLIH